MAINQLIARSGPENYEQIRKGFYQRPEERQANRLAALQERTAEYDLQRTRESDQRTQADWARDHVVKAAKWTLAGKTPQERATRYAQARQGLQSLGLDMSKSAPQYSMDVEQKLKMFASEIDDTSTFGKINPSQYTPESVAEYQRTGDYSTLKAVPKDALVKVYTGEQSAGAGVKKASEAYGTGVGESATQRNTYATSASKQKAQLESVALAMANGAKTGKWEEAIMEMKSAAKTLGIPVGDLSGQELIRTVSNEMALRLRNPDSGLGLTGNTSNRDLEFLKNSVVGLGRTEQGNVEIIKLLNKFNDLTIDVAAEQNKIIMKNGGAVPIDLDSQLIEYVNNYKFFTDAERTKIETILDGKQEDYGDMSPDQIKRLQELRKQQGVQ